MRCKKVVDVFNAYTTMVCGQFFREKTVAHVETSVALKKEIRMYLRHSNVLICKPWDEFIKDEVRLKALSPLQASYIGYHYGAYCFLKNKSKYPSLPFNCFEPTSTNTFTIYMLDRQGHVIYLNKTNGIQKKETPLQILSERSVITKFPPLQSCYIGILAGIAHAKTQFLSALS